jgi:endoglucanase
MKHFRGSLMIILLFGLQPHAYSQTGAIRINQLGYYTTANKIAMVVYPGANTFEVIDAAGNSVEFTGEMSPLEYWRDAGDSIRRCDFSGLVKTGTYKIRIPGFGESYSFEISDTVLRKAAYASLKSYYYQRCSYELTEPYAGLWARAAGHPDTACILHSSTGREGKISSPGGWYDAGDYGKYVINAGISVATLLSFHENFNDFFADGTIHIPESGNGRNDLLDEVKYELDWLKAMQDEDGGVFVKLTTLSFAGFIMPAAATATRYAIGKSTASALDFAAMMAMAGRIYADYDTSYAADCIIRAGNAWNWAKAHPAVYFSNPSDVSTGEYGDRNVSDEFIWAAAELYITTQEAEYKTYLESKSSSLTYQNAPGWPNVRPLASLSLATRANGLSESLLTAIRNSIVSTSNNWLNQIATSPCRIPSFGYYWGSNSEIANIGVGLLYAYILTNDPKYIIGAAECADYLLGKNATGYSFESSYGYKTPVNFHHRPSASDGITQPVPGFVSGGPNAGREDGQRYPFGQPAKSFVDVTGSYASNEVCINWNSPLTALLAGVDAVMGDGSEVGFEVPTSANNPPVIKLASPAYGSTAGSDQPVIVKGTVTDPDGISTVELYLDARFAGVSASGEFEWELDSLSFESHLVTILAFDQFGLTSEVTNQFTYVPVHNVPGKVEAERYSSMSGVDTEPTTDQGGGVHLTSLDAGDMVEYTLNVLETGDYLVEYRVASSAGGGQFDLRKSSYALISSIGVGATGGAQAWATLSDTIPLNEGKQKIRLWVVTGGWNLNWINFEKIETTSIHNPEAQGSGNDLFILPNPVYDHFTVAYHVAEISPMEFTLWDVNGRLVDRQSVENIQSRDGEFEWRGERHLGSGTYLLRMVQKGNQVASFTFLKSQ